MNSAPFRILVLGGTGVFGQRICQRLAREPAVSILLAGRSAVKAQAMARKLGGEHPAAEVEGIGLEGLSGSLARVLGERSLDLVIHAAGPYQGQDYGVAECCIAHGVHYLDLADGRDFVCGFARLDQAARAAGVVAVTGVSSVPGLSSAIVDHLAAGLAAIESIAVGISPGSRAPLGRGAIAGILSYGGQPIAQWRDGRWQRTVGLQDLQRWHFHAPGAPPIGARLLAACDVPDLSLFPTRYAPVKTVSFHAGMELTSLMLCLWSLSWLVRLGLLASLAPLAALADAFSRPLRALGGDRGAMYVEIVATTADGQRERRVWTLIAERNHGPFVPCLPVVILTRQLARGGLAAGARPCLGLFALADFAESAEDLAISSAWETFDA
ncbi:MAG: saccharopine dehydrogenase NADP-binding domain-containing protein [Pseudomonadota bacterium]